MKRYDLMRGACLEAVVSEEYLAMIIGLLHIQPARDFTRGSFDPVEILKALGEAELESGVADPGSRRGTLETIAVRSIKSNKAITFVENKEGGA